MFRANGAIYIVYSSLLGGNCVAERNPVAKIGRIIAGFGDIRLVLPAQITDTIEYRES